MNKFLKIKKNRGMSYVELIVVLGIFSVMSSIVMFNYGEFQAKVDVKNLASDIALKIVEAQKFAVAGKVPASPPANWKPAYGVYFDASIPELKEFIYFKDLDTISGDPVNGYEPGEGEELDIISITTNNNISSIDRCSDVDCTTSPFQITFPLSITFKRPDSGANFTDQDGQDIIVSPSQFIRITIQSPKEAKAYIKIYPSGRIQIN